MPESYQSIEARIQLAILELENVESPNIKAWARGHNLPYQRLLARYKGRSSRSERTPSGRKLDESQEAALCRYIDFLMNFSNFSSNQHRIKFNILQSN
jgi:hypothetical protein